MGALYASKEECAALIRTCRRSLWEVRELHSRVAASGLESLVYIANLLIQAYGKCGGLDDARSLFVQRMESRNRISWRLFLTACIENNQTVAAREVLDAMPEHDLVCCTSVVTACSRTGLLEQAEVVFVGIPEPDTVARNAMLAAYARNGQPWSAKQAFDGIPEPNLSSWNSLLLVYPEDSLFWGLPCRDAVSWNTMIMTNAGRGDLESAGYYFFRMPCWSTVSWNTLLAAYVEQGSVEAVVHCFHSTPQRDVLSWTSLLSAYAAASDEVGARAAFVRMPEHDAVSWTSMLGALHDLAEVEFMFSAGHHNRDIAAWNSLLAAYARTRVDDAERVFKHLMPSRNVVSWNSLLAGYLHCQRPRDAGRLFGLMPQHNAISWNSTLAATAAVGTAPARQAFDKMPVGCRDAVSWCCLLGAAVSSSGELDQAERILRLMPYHCMVACTTMLAAYGASGSRPEMAKLTFDGMQQVDEAAWVATIVAHFRAGKLSQAQRLFQAMPLHGPIPCTALLAARACNGRLSGANDELCRMCVEGVMPGDLTAAFTCLLFACSHAGDVTAARSLFMSMLGDHGVEATKEQFCCLVDLLGRVGCLDQAEELVEQMPVVGDGAESTSLLAATALHWSGVG